MDAKTLAQVNKSAEGALGRREISCAHPKSKSHFPKMLNAIYGEPVVEHFYNRDEIVAFKQKDGAGRKFVKRRRIRHTKLRAKPVALAKCLQK
jgi:hypothetical protein